MQITLNLPDELLRQLLQQPDPEKFAQQAIAQAMRQQTKPPVVSRWKKLAQCVRENPISLGDYAEQAKRDGAEFRENFSPQEA